MIVPVLGQTPSDEQYRYPDRKIKLGIPDVEGVAYVGWLQSSKTADGTEAHCRLPRDAKNYIITVQRLPLKPITEFHRDHRVIFHNGKVILHRLLAGPDVCLNVGVTRDIAAMCT
jgi:hypothetical protein